MKKRSKQWTFPEKRAINRILFQLFDTVDLCKVVFVIEIYINFIDLYINNT